MDHQDSFWVARARRGDNQAFGLLIDKYRSQLEYLISKALGADEVPDLVQETFLQAYLSLDRLRDPERFGAWLYGIALNLVKMHYRQRRQPHPISWEELHGGTTGRLDGRLNTDSAEELVLMRAVHAALQSAIDKLSELNREAIVLHYVDGLSYQEMAELLSVPLSTVKSRLHKARQRLRDDLVLALASPARKETPRMIEATVYEVYTVERRDLARHTVVVLKAKERESYLPIWIGEFEGTAIQLQLQGVELPRPLTYELVANLLAAAGAKIEAVHVQELRDETFIGSIQLRSNRALQQVDARPSDALALALRVDAPVFVHADVWEKAGTASPTELRSAREDVEVTSVQPLALPEQFLKAGSQPTDVEEQA